MPPLGFLFIVLEVPWLMDLRANHVLISVTLSAVALRYQFQTPRYRTVLLMLLVALLSVFLQGIEWMHILAGRGPLNGLVDVRMIVYSPLYGGIILYVMYALYLTTLNAKEKEQHLGFFIRWMSWFHIFFLIYWVLLYLSWFEPIARADLLHSNSVAYGALFVLSTIILYPTVVGLSKAWYYTFVAVNISAVLANQSRGANIAAVVFLSYLLFQHITLKKLMVGSLGGLTLVVMIANQVSLELVLGDSYQALSLVLDQIRDSYQNHEVQVVDSQGLVMQENSISAFSRIGSNYYSFLSFLDNPVIGIGQRAAYAIQVFGSGVHSFHFLLVNATGLFGLTTFLAMLVAITFAQSRVIFSGRLAIMFILFYVYVLVFVNDIPVCFALVFALLPSCGTEKLRAVTAELAERKVYDRIVNGP